MVSKLTILEPHFDNAQFGPATMDEPNAGSVADEEAQDNGSKTRATMAFQGLVGFVVMFVVLWFVMSRLGGSAEGS